MSGGGPIDTSQLSVPEVAHQYVPEQGAPGLQQQQRMPGPAPGQPGMMQNPHQMQQGPRGNSSFDFFVTIKYLLLFMGY